MRRHLLGIGLIAICLAPQSAFAVTPVHAADDLQVKINASACGDVLVLDAAATGASWTGNFIIPNHGCSAATPTTLTTSGTLPAAGTRIGPGNSAQLARVTSSNDLPVFTSDFSANGWVFIGLDVIPTKVALDGGGARIAFLLGQNGLGGTPLYATLTSQLPHDIIIDRCYIHGPTTADTSSGIMAHVINFTLKDSYVSDWHSVGGEAKAFLSTNSPGPFLITNNYITASGINVLFGGADPTIAGLVPGQLTFTNNYLTKPREWWDHCTTGAETGCDGHVYGGILWTVKNVFEFKSMDTALVDHNIFEYAWQGVQGGVAILFTNRNQSGGAPQTTVSNVTFTNNIIRHADEGINILGLDDTHGGSPPPFTSVIATNDVIRNNLWYDLSLLYAGGSSLGGRWIQGMRSGTVNLSITHNTAVNDSNGGGAFGAYYGNLASRGYGLDSPDVSTGFTYRDNLARHGLYGYYLDVLGTGAANFALFFPSATHSNNVLAGMLEAGYTLATYPAGVDTETNAQFDAGFVSAAAGDFRLQPTAVKGYRAASDGTDIGVNVCPGPFPDPNGDGKTSVNCGQPAPVKLPLPLSIACGAQVSPIPLASEGPVRVSFCHDGKGVTGWAGVLDNVRQPFTLATDGQVYSDGLQQFTGTFTLTAGAHSVSIIPIYGPAGDGPASLPFSLTVRPRMSAPVNVRIN